MSEVLTYSQVTRLSFQQKQERTVHAFKVFLMFNLKTPTLARMMVKILFDPLLIKRLSYL